MAKLKFQSEVAGKGLNNNDEDDSIKFPHPRPSKDEVVCAPKSSETKEQQSRRLRSRIMGT